MRFTIGRCCIANFFAIRLALISTDTDEFCLRRACNSRFAFVALKSTITKQHKAMTFSNSAEVALNASPLTFMMSGFTSRIQLSTQLINLITYQLNVVP